MGQSELPLEIRDEQHPEAVDRALRALKSSPGTAIVEIERLAQQGSLRCMIELGRSYALGIGVNPSMAQAEQWFRRVAEAGSVRGSFYLGRFLMRQRKYKEARLSLEYAAARGYALAQHDLGKIYFLGLGVDKDVQRARRLLIQASTQGSVFATRLLSTLLIKNGESSRDKLRGFWLRLRVYFDAILVIFTEGLSSEKLMR